MLALGKPAPDGHYCTPIDSDELWSKAKARQQRVSAENARLRDSLKRGVLENDNVAGRKPGNFWSGLLVCGVRGCS